MPIELPDEFGTQVSELNRHVLAYEAAVETDRRDEAQRNALLLACQMLRQVDLYNLDSDLDQAIEGSRPDARRILRSTRDFRFFLNTIEKGILRQAGIDLSASIRIRRLLDEARVEAIDAVDKISGKEIRYTVESLMGEICEQANAAMSKHQGAVSAKERRHRHTRITNVFGTVAILSNAAAGFAVAGSLIALPAVSLASIAASAIVGKVATDIKPK